MTSVGVAAFIGFWAFWILLAFGYVVGELSPKQIATFLILWIVGRVGLAYMPAPAPALFSPYVAILDIALVIMMLDGDVRLS
ncbi:MAG TPA: hypothetical protein VNR64_11045 [Vicinamibacterales bacterium]|nr:hypothetical protein [Vicinamibacterales bacterium]